MSVLKGEGRVPILYGGTRLPTAPYRDLYLARPDLAGRYPAVVVVHGDTGLTPGVRDLCRRLARYELAVAAPDLYWGTGPGRLSDLPAPQRHADVMAVVDAFRHAWSEWARPGRLGAVGLGSGGDTAARLATVENAALVLLGGPFHHLGGTLAGRRGPLLGLVAGTEEGTADAVRSLRATAGGGEWAVYRDTGRAFYDDGSPDYAAAAAEDALERMVSFFDRHLATPSPPPKGEVSAAAGG